MRLLELEEVWKGLTDVPIFLAALVFAAMLALYEVAKNTNGENNHE